MAKIHKRVVPALVGRKEAARMLGLKPENIGRVASLPTPLQDRGIEGFEVSTGPLWPRVEIEALVEARKREQIQRVKDAKALRERREREDRAAKRARERVKAKRARGKGRATVAR